MGWAGRSILQRLLVLNESSRIVNVVYIDSDRRQETSVDLPFELEGVDIHRVLYIELQGSRSFFLARYPEKEGGQRIRCLVLRT